MKNNLIAGLDTYHVFELKGNLSDSTVWNTGDADDIYVKYLGCFCHKVLWTIF